MFKKLETYNEIAEYMGERKVRIYFGEWYYKEYFDNYKDWKKYVKTEFIDEVADQLLHSNGWEFGVGRIIAWDNGQWTSKFVFELTDN